MQIKIAFIIFLIIYLILGFSSQLFLFALLPIFFIFLILFRKDINFLKEKSRKNKIIFVFIGTTIISLSIFGTIHSYISDFQPALLQDDELASKGWYEKNAEKKINLFFALGNREYENTEGYQGVLVVFTLKTLIYPTLSDVRKEILKRLEESEGIKFYCETMVEGGKKNEAGHKVKYIIIDALTDAKTSGYLSRFVVGASLKFIATYWFCSNSNTLVVSVGFAQTGYGYDVPVSELEHRLEIRDYNPKTWDALTELSYAIKCH